MNLATIDHSSATMSSLEISELVESRHDKVRQSIERLAERGVITLPPVGEVSNTGPGPKTISVYLVGKRDSYIIVAQLSPEFTARLVDRWQELEQDAKKFDPATLTRLDILQLAMESEQGRIKAEAERDYAIATKAQIGSRREATAMASAAIAKREAARLRDQLGFSTRHATVKAVEGATARRFDWLPLRKWCVAHGAFPASVADPLYGTVKAWPSDALGEVYGIDLSELFPSEATHKEAA